MNKIGSQQNPPYAENQYVNFWITESTTVEAYKQDDSGNWTPVQYVYFLGGTKYDESGPFSPTDNHNYGTEQDNKSGNSKLVLMYRTIN